MKRSLIVLLLIGVMFVTACNPTQKGHYDEFAKCLSAEGVVFYGAFWCPHCQRVKKEFGDSWQYVNYVECDGRDAQGQPEVCQAKGIDSYMTAILKDGDSPDKWLIGEPQFYELSQKTGCALPAKP
ncbi:MAG: thioredoxin domain-containing protein [Candidatus Nanoarchaeia archaeon]